MRELSEGAELLLATTTMLKDTKDGEAIEAFGKLLVDYTHEADELVIRGLVIWEDGVLRLTDAGQAFADARIKEYRDREAFSHLEDGCAGFEMRLRFDFYELVCERTITVPAEITFEEFHTIIQATMNWMNYHLYDFMLQDKSGDMLVIAAVEPTSHTPVDSMWQMFAMDDDDEGERIDAAEVRLDSYFPDVKRAIYSYDYGDGWSIFIECVGATTLEDGFPSCLAGTGDAPPEDVGGEGGFQEFLMTVSDPEDPECAEMREWGLSQGFEPFDLVGVQARLRRWRDFTARDTKSYALAPGGQAKPEPQKPSEEEVAAHDKAVNANMAACATYLKAFEESLRASRLSEKTVKRHLDNMDLYLNAFLNDGDVATMEEGAALVDQFMRVWAPAYGWATKTSLKGYATSLKKFYKCMFDKGLVSGLHYYHVLDEIKFCMDEWLEPFNYPSYWY